MSDARSGARAVLGAFAAAVAVGVLLLVAFEPDVQQASATELVDRRDDARAFLIADYVFIALYAIALPLAVRRFGEAAPWVRTAALLMAAAGLVDLAENTLLLSATGDVTEGAVDAAHALEIPKVALFLAGLVPAIAAVVRAAAVLRRA